MAGSAGEWALVGLPHDRPRFVQVYAVKRTRDAELLVEDEFEGEVVEVGRRPHPRGHP